MIKFENVSLSYGGQDIFKRLDLFLTESDRSAIVGPNGSGKSTLLNMIIGDCSFQNFGKGHHTYTDTILLDILPQGNIQVF